MIANGCNACVYTCTQILNILKFYNNKQSWYDPCNHLWINSHKQPLPSGYALGLWWFMDHKISAYQGCYYLHDYTDNCLSAIYTAVVCADLSAPMEGRVVLTGNLFGSQAVYGCNEGLALNGSGSRVCRADGQWSGIEPTCVTTPDTPTRT